MNKYLLTIFNILFIFLFISCDVSKTKEKELLITTSGANNELEKQIEIPEIEIPERQKEKKLFFTSLFNSVPGTARYLVAGTGFVGVQYFSSYDDIIKDKSKYIFHEWEIGSETLFFDIHKTKPGNEIIISAMDKGGNFI